jgi:hypothetical protein
MAIRKRWEDHSLRWQREHTQRGESRSRWNAYLKLSAKTRRTVDPNAYAKGISVPRFMAAETYRSAYVKMTEDMFGRVRTVVKGLALMTAEELSWTARASDEAISRRARNQNYIRQGVNPWWYN